MPAEAARREESVLISALTGEGVDELLECAAGRLRKGARLRTSRSPRRTARPSPGSTPMAKWWPTSDRTGSRPSIEVRLSETGLGTGFEARSS